MKIRLIPIVAALSFTGLITLPVYAASTVSNAQIQSLETNLATLQAEVKSLKKELVADQTTTKQTKAVRLSKLKTLYKRQRALNKHPHASSSANNYENDVVKQDAQELLVLLQADREYLPIDLDVPGQAFVSTGPYVGVPYQFAGTDLVINSPSVNTDIQLLSIRKSILHHLHDMTPDVVKEPNHSHLLLSGAVQIQGDYADIGGAPSTSDINVTNMSLDSFFIGPSDWTLGFIELSFDNANPTNSFYRVTNSNVFVNKAFVTIGDFDRSPFYATAGQYYVPFGTYSSVMISDVLTKLLARTKARALLLGYDEQGDNSFFASIYAFRGDSHASSVPKVDNGGINVGFKFDHGFFSGKAGGGVIANLADSGGMQSANGFSSNEQLIHRVPAYNLRGIFSFGHRVDLIGEWVGASTRFNPTDMSFNNHGAKPWALDTEAVYSFTILDNKPSSLGVGYEKSYQALSLGLPLFRYSLVATTSLWRNTLQSIELRRDREYAASDTASGAVGSTAFTTSETGKYDNVITASFDYYF